MTKYLIRQGTYLALTVAATLIVVIRVSPTLIPSPTPTPTATPTPTPTPGGSITWGSETRLTSDGVLYYGMATSGTTVHLVRGNGSVLYRRSTNEGATFGSEVNLGSGWTYLDTPLFIDGNNVYIIYVRNLRSFTDWCCNRDGGDIFMRVSRDGGVTWNPEVQLTTAQSAYRIAVAASGANVHVTWMDFRNGNWDIYYRRSQNNGLSWNPEVRLVTGTSQRGTTVGAERPTIAVLGNAVYVAWMDARDGAPPCYTAPECTEIYYKRSLDNGATWGADVRLTNEPLWSARPTITATTPGTLLIAYEQQNSSNHNEIYVLRSTDNGNTWATTQKLSNNASLTDSSHPPVLINDSLAQLAWHNYSDSSNAEIFFRSSNNAGVTWNTQQQLSQAAGQSLVPMLGQTNNYVHVIWSDDRSGATELWYRRGSLSPTPTPTPTPNSLQFATSTASVTEAPNVTTKVDLIVTRVGDTSGLASLSYATTDGTASDRSDYLTASGTLRFAAGETSKNITVFIVNDSYGEVPESFNVTLLDPIGSTLGAPSVVTVTIISDENVDGPNPVKNASFDSDFFVRQHYIDFFSREPDSGGLAFWSNQITECATDSACSDLRRANVSAAFYVSIEFQETGYLVYRIYESAYGNIPNMPVPVRFNEFLPDTQQIGQSVVVGVGNWQTQLENNKVAFAADFVARSKFVATYSTSLTPTQFVGALDGNGGGMASATERASAINEFGGAVNTADTAARARALRRVAENSLLARQEFSRAFVLMQYFGYLRRNPNDAPDADFGGYNFWLGKLNQFGGNYINAEMVRSFIESGEYKQRFGP